MLPEKWQEIKDQINENFEILNSGEEVIEDIPNSKVEYVEFNGPLGRMRLEFETRPKVLDKKTLYSGRIGSNVKVEYVYAEDDFVNQLKVYKWDDTQDDWVEAELSL